ncbi:hypothetical protein PVAP13_4NG076757 [Panicum virgatum]|uniref:Uncharacterized protein n=1 Tax=Panicum virgatum TaxID=38727 RepID=A0A8T0T2Y4_PANVG|nr:hypothetical protein PVAP13_4NG076757 [Panicum virgatum]
MPPSASPQPASTVAPNWPPPLPLAVQPPACLCRRTQPAGLLGPGDWPTPSMMPLTRVLQPLLLARQHPRAGSSWSRHSGVEKGCAVRQGGGVRASLSMAERTRGRWGEGGGHQRRTAPPEREELEGSQREGRRRGREQQTEREER